MNTTVKIVEKLASLVAVVGAIKNIVRDSGYITESLGNNVSKLADKMHKRATEIHTLLNNEGHSSGNLAASKLRAIEARVMANPKIAEVLEKLLAQLSECVKELIDVGIDEGITWLIAWIDSHLKAEVKRVKE